MYCKAVLGLTFAAVLVTGCATTNQFEEKYIASADEQGQVVVFIRDNKAAKVNKEDCSTDLYVNNVKLNQFLVGEHSSYRLKPGIYTIEVKNCQGRCSTYDANVELEANGSNLTYVISADAAGQPFIYTKK